MGGSRGGVSAARTPGDPPERDRGAIARGGPGSPRRALRRDHPCADLRARRSLRRLDAAVERTEFAAVVAVLVEGANLFDLQLGHFLGTGPDDRLAAFVRLQRELVRLLRREAQRTAQHQDDELEGVILVIL